MRQLIDTEGLTVDAAARRVADEEAEPLAAASLKGGAGPPVTTQRLRPSDEQGVRNIPAVAGGITGFATGGLSTAAGIGATALAGAGSSLLQSAVRAANDDPDTPDDIKDLLRRAVTEGSVEALFEGAGRGAIGVASTGLRKLGTWIVGQGLEITPAILAKMPGFADPVKAQKAISEQFVRRSSIPNSNVGADRLQEAFIDPNTLKLEGLSGEATRAGVVAEGGRGVDRALRRKQSTLRGQAVDVDPEVNAIEKVRLSLRDSDLTSAVRPGPDRVRTVDTGILDPQGAKISRTVSEPTTVRKLRAMTPDELLALKRGTGKQLDDRAFKAPGSAILPGRVAGNKAIFDNALEQFEAAVPGAKPVTDELTRDIGLRNTLRAGAVRRATRGEAVPRAETVMAMLGRVGGTLASSFNRVASGAGRGIARTGEALTPRDTFSRATVPATTRLLGSEPDDRGQSARDLVRESVLSILESITTQQQDLEKERLKQLGVPTVTPPQQVSIRPID